MKLLSSLKNKVNSTQEQLSSKIKMLKQSDRKRVAMLVVLLLVGVFGVVGSVMALTGGSQTLYSQAFSRSEDQLAQREPRQGRQQEEKADNSDRNRTPRPTPAPTGTPTPTPGGNGGTQPYAGAPKCNDSLHNPTEWHGLWNYEAGCHYDHEHKMNPHDLDDVFGTQIYEWAGGSLSFPWQTYAGAGVNFEKYADGTCTENTCKHEGYKWLYYRDRTSADNVKGALLLGTHVITDARVQYHGIGGELGALTRVHSVWLEARACYKGEISDATCGTYQGGGWLDLGRLNYPNRGDYQPLPGDPAEFADTDAERAPYRIHAIGKNSLDSWQSEGNVYNYLPTDPSGLFRLRVGYGVHFLQGESTGETNPQNAGDHAGSKETHFWCLDKNTNKYTCNNNNSAAAMFRTWVSIPQNLDGSIYDEDGTKNGYFTFNGYTNRYGDIVDNCQSVGLDCVPAIAKNFPVGGCQNSTGICKAAYRGSVEQDGYDADISPDGEWWIEYPN